MKHARIAAEIFNRPHLIEPGYGRVFVSALARHGFNIRSLCDAEGVAYAADDVQALADDYERGSRKLFAEVDGIAVIPIEGTLTHRYGHIDPHSGMTGYDGIQAKLEAAVEDESVRGILLDINSPGGAVSGCFDLADQIYAARQSKPIWAVCDELAASAAYAIASAATRIVAPRTAQIGSIGVLTMHADQSKMIENMGVDVTFIFAGDHKIDGNGFEPLPAEVKADIQADIDAVYGLFVDLVARNRSGMDARAVRDTQARVYSAPDAVQIGLADAVMPTHDVIESFNQALQPQRSFSVIQRGASAMALSLFGRKPKAQASPEQAAPENPTIADQSTASGFKSEAADDSTITGISAEAVDANGDSRTWAFTPAPDEPVFTEAQARAQFGPANNAARLETLVKLCSDNQCDTLAKPLHDRGVTAEQAEAIMADVAAIRDKMAATFPEDQKAAVALADQFAIAAHGSATAQFANALGSLMVEACARMSGDEVDHHPPESSQAAGQGNLNLVDFYAR